MRRFGSALAAVTVIACQPATPVEPTPDRRNVRPSLITLEVGETKVLHGLTFRFIGVPEDSRCATDVRCVWSGNAVVQLEVGPAFGRGPSYLVELNTDVAPRERVLMELRIRLETLHPAPLSTRTIPPDAYVVELLVAGVDAEPGTPGLSVTTDALTYAPGDVVGLTLANETSRAYWFNVCTDRLERRQNNVWVTLDLERLCLAIAQELPPRSTAQTSYPLEPYLATGDYRLAVRLSDSVIVRSNAFRIQP